MVLLVLGIALAVLGALGLFHVLGIGLAVSIILLVVGVAVLLVADPVRRRF
jgi:hypothetical protein